MNESYKDFTARMGSFDMEFVSDDELMHHGVKGMKWGVRKKTRVGTVYTTNGQKRYAANTSFSNISRKNRADRPRINVSSLDFVSVGSTKKEAKYKADKKTIEWVNKHARSDRMCADLQKTVAFKRAEAHVARYEKQHVSEL